MLDYKITLLIQVFVMIMSFMYSLKLIRNEVFPAYMRGFYWYNLVGVFVALYKVFFYFIIKNISFAISVNNISVFFHFIFLSRFIYQFIQNSTLKKFLIFYQFISLILILFIQLRVGISVQVNAAFSIVNFGLFVFGLAFFYQLFDGAPDIHLFKEPSFWIVTGAFLSSAIHIPISAAADYFDHHAYNSNSFIKNIFLTFPRILLHLLLIKSFQCTRILQKI